MTNRNQQQLVGTNKQTSSNHFNSGKIQQTIVPSSNVNQQTRNYQSNNISQRLLLSENVQSSVVAVQQQQTIIKPLMAPKEMSTVNNKSLVYNKLSF